MTIVAIQETSHPAIPKASKPPARMVSSAILLWSIAAVIGLLWLGQCFALEPSVPAKPSEDEVKAVYLFNFGKFVHWPAATPGPARSFDLCVIGQDPLTEVLTRTTFDEHLDDRPVRVRTLDAPEDGKGCAIVFLGANEASRVEQDLAALKGADALTVSDLPDFLKRGGMLQFVLDGNRVRFAVNLDAVQKTDLQLSSELLKVAAWVVGKPRREATE